VEGQRENAEVTAKCESLSRFGNICGRLKPRIRIYACLKSGSQKLKKDVSDERGYDSDFKIGDGKNIFHRPNEAPLLTYTRALKLSHQEIGIKKKDYETYFDRRSPSIFLH
jgi:hypothetical protein